MTSINGNTFYIGASTVCDAASSHGAMQHARAGCCSGASNLSGKVKRQGCHMHPIATKHTPTPHHQF